MSSSNSRPKGSSKKPQQAQELQKRISQLIHQNLQLTLTLKKLTNNATEMKSLQKIEKQQFLKDLSEKDKQIDRLQTFNQAQAEHILSLTQKRDQTKIQNGCLIYQVEKLKKQLEQERIAAKHQYDELKIYSESQVKRHESFMNEYQIAINQRVDYLSQNQSLQTQLTSTKEQQKRQIADKDRDKLQSIDLIKNEMQDKIKDLKNYLLTMRRDQMETNTRLTVLQNQQLLEQLEYQSKHTEKILKLNIQLEKKLSELVKEIEVEKEICEQLAKRSTMGKRIIKNLTQKIASLQEQLQKHPPQQQQPTKVQNNRKKSRHQSLLIQLPGQQTIKSLSKTVKLLQSQLTSAKQSLQKSQQQKFHFQQLYQQSQPKYEYYLKVESDLRLLMIRFLDCALKGDKNREEHSGEYDIQRLKDKEIASWTNEEIEVTVKMLLTYLKPHFTMKNMKTDFLKHQKWQIVNKNDDQLNPPERISECTQLNPSTKCSKRHKYPKIKSLSSSNLNTFIQQPFTKPSNVSTNIPPSRNSFLHQNFQEQKHKSLSRQSKNLSQHNLSYLNSGSVQSSFSKQNRRNDMKQNIEQTHEFRPEKFTKKDKIAAKLLVRTNLRDWGKKVQMKPKGVFLVQEK